MLQDNNNYYYYPNHKPMNQLFLNLVLNKPCNLHVNAGIVMSTSVIILSPYEVSLHRKMQDLTKVCNTLWTKRILSIMFNPQSDIAALIEIGLLKPFISQIGSTGNQTWVLLFIRGISATVLAHTNWSWRRSRRYWNCYWCTNTYYT